MTIDCDRCAARGLACGACAVTVVVSGFPASQGMELDAADLRALSALADAGVIPPLRYATHMARAS